MCVEVDLRKTLVPKVHVRWKEYGVEYEDLSLIWFDCGCFGHRTKLCPLNAKLKKRTKMTADEGSGTVERERRHDGPKMDTNGTNFGPRIIAQCCKGRPRMARNQGEGDPAWIST